MSKRGSHGEGVRNVVWKHGRRTKEEYEVNNNEARKERNENMHSIGVWW